MGGGKGYGSGGSSSTDMNPMEWTQMNIASTLATESTPLRKGFNQLFENVLGLQEVPNGTGTITNPVTMKSYNLGNPNYDVTKLPT